LLELETHDRDRAEALGVTVPSIEQNLQQRAEMLRLVYPKFSSLCDRLFGQAEPYLPTLWQLWLPLAQHLMTQRQALPRPLIQGVLGGQGTGKTTLGKILTLILQTQGYTLLSWSLDDLYKTYRDRLQLQQAHPDLIWRGPPGTHDVDLGLQVMKQLRQAKAGQVIPIPRFDKALHNGMGDRVEPEPVQNIDIVLFEGWFVGAQPVDPAVFAHAPAPICSDRDRAFAQSCNTRLANYLPLWKTLDSLWVLYLPDYTLSKQWRQQAEAQMKASGKPGMTDAEINAFVEYFWKALHPDLFIRPAIERANVVIEINSDHSSENVYCGSQA
jgi:D-glycerate 3-kinase